MKILAIDKVRDKATPERIRELFLKEISQCVRLYLADVVREMYFRQTKISFTQWLIKLFYYRE